MEYRVGGTVLNVEPQKIVEKLLVSYSDLKYRPRIFGYDIKLEREEFELYLNTLDEKEYFLEVTFYKSEKELLLLLENLKHSFLSLGLKFDIWYCLEDEKGDEISPEIIYFNNHPTSKEV
ncbi:hypothetical protein [Aquimarina aquimarini]|uniref:hypothetical protein n=1 Tax=Aquimarina aquimarini TaxID=1191734 RepID=UPI000D54F809|nr:hypothetical protein [Aquimarina aquimarini]